MTQTQNTSQDDQKSIILLPDLIKFQDIKDKTCQKVVNLTYELLPTDCLWLTTCVCQREMMCRLCAFKYKCLTVSANLVCDFFCGLPQCPFSVPFSKEMIQ